MRASLENENNSIQSFPFSHNYKVMMMIYFNDSINLAGDLSEEYHTVLFLGRLIFQIGNHRKLEV
jgi:hypothetical protein